MLHGIAVAPGLVQSLHHIHELQALTLVVVASSKLDGKCVLVAIQFNSATFVQRLLQRHIAVVGVSSEYLLFTNEELRLVLIYGENAKRITMSFEEITSLRLDNAFTSEPLSISVARAITKTFQH